MKYLIVILLFVSSLYSLTLQKGMNIVGMTGTEILSEGRFRSDVDIIYGTVNGTWQSFNPTKNMSFNGLKELKKNQGYIVVAARVMKIPNATFGIGTQIKCPQLDEGINITPMYSVNFANGFKDINGSVVNSIFSTRGNSYISYNPAVPLPLNSLQQSTNGRFYVVDVQNDNVASCGAKTSDASWTDDNGTDVLPFEFFPQSNVPRNTFIASNTISIDAGESPTSAYVDYGVIIKNGDVNNSSSEQFVMQGDQIKIMLLSSSEYNTEKVSKLVYRDKETTFNVTTLPSVKKLPFEFWARSNVELSTSITSNEAIVNIGDEPSSAYVDNGVIIKNGDLESASWSQFLMKGDKVQIKFLSSSEYNTESVATLTYRDAEAEFKLKTIEDSTPDVNVTGTLPFNFLSQSNVQRDTFVTSNEVLVSIGTESTKAYVNKGVIIKNGDVNNSSSEQLIKSGDKIKIKFQSSSEYNTTSTSTLVYQNARATFSVTTFSSSDIKADFIEVKDAPISFPVLSNEVLVKFGSSPTKATVDNGLLVKNGDLLSASTFQLIEAGDKIQIQLSSSDEYNTTVSSTLTYLTENSKFNVTTVEFADLIPDDFIFGAIETNPVRTVISNQVGISGISQGLSANVEILFGASDVTIIQNGVDTLARTVNVNAGDKLNLKVAVGSEPAIVKLSVGEKSSNFDITVSDVIDSTPDKFELSRKDNLDPNIQIFSDEVVISGLGDFIKTYAAGLNANVYVNGVSNGNYALVQNEDIVKLGMKTPAQLGTPRVGQLYIGGEMADFNITTTSTNPDQDNNPTDFDIAPALNVDVSTFVTSDEIVVLGINVLSTVSLDKGILIVNGVEIPSNKTSVVEFDKIKIKAQSSDSYVTEVVSNLTIGVVTKQFKIVTKEQPVNILIENQRYRKDQNISLPFASAPAAISWEIVNGRLPSGLIFDANKRVIEGTTSNESNISTYTIKATIINGESAQVKRTIEISDFISTVNQTPSVDGGVEFDDTWYKANKTLGVPIIFSRLFTSGIIQVNSALNWLDIEPERMTLEGAKTYCENLEFGGFNNWRLPTIYELQTINGHNIEFDNIGAGFMWSSTPSAEKKDWYWYVDFGNGGKSYIINKTNEAFVKCVVGAR